MLIFIGAYEIDSFVQCKVIDISFIYVFNITLGAISSVLTLSSLGPATEWNTESRDAFNYFKLDFQLKQHSVKED